MGYRRFKEDLTMEHMARPLIAKHYRHIFEQIGEVISIDYLEKNNVAKILDKEYGIDVIVKVRCKIPARGFARNDPTMPKQYLIFRFSFQEKSREPYALGYGDITVETGQHEKDENVKQISQYHTYAVVDSRENPTRLLMMYVIRGGVINGLVARGLIRPEFRRNEKHGKASFIGIPIDKIPDSGIIYRYVSKETKEDFGEVFLDNL